MKQFLIDSGIKKNHHIIVHSSYKNIRNVFPVSVQKIINSLQEIVTTGGSLIMPVFTYNFQLVFGNIDAFDPKTSKSKTGAITEVFRNYPNVTRTASPTHSFALWGKVTEDIKADNSPDSPLGKGSVLEWLSNNEDTYVLMLGTNFSSLSFLHYLEIKAKVPWYDYSPWDYMFLRKAGISLDGIQKLKEIPGCSKSFINFEYYMLANEMIHKEMKNKFFLYYIPIKLLEEEGIKFLNNHSSSLLCPEGTCKACDLRRGKFLK